LVDLYFTESLGAVEFDPARFRIERGELVKAPVVWEEYKRYKITASGVSPRALPGTPGGMHIATSDEHDERGDVITDRHVPEVRRAVHEKRMRKLVKIAEGMEPPLLRGDGGVVAVAWGSTSMPLLDYVEEAGVGLALFRDLYPLPRDSWVERLNSANEVVAVEVNYRGQFADYLSARGSRCLVGF
jgi:2-oxoglutarate ferredoxin oxidoreductase subunit alpha